MSIDSYQTKILFVLGLSTLVCIGGNLTAHLEVIPYSNWLEPAFEAAEAHHEKWFGSREKANPTQKSDRPEPPFGLVRHRHGAATPGYTLFTVAGQPTAKLVNLQGEVVHRWGIRFRDVWNEPEHVSPAPNAKIYWRRVALFPNGDLIACFVASSDTPYGYGLVKLNKNSEVIWRYGAHTHHDFDVTPAGRVVVLEHEWSSDELDLSWHPEFGRGKTLVDYVTLLSSSGRRLRRVSLLELLRDSPYEGLATMYPNTIDEPEEESWDPTHANGIDYISEEFARHHTFARSGQFLVSMRTNDAVALIDLRNSTMTWASRGFWKMQHDPDPLPNGNLLVFDNSGYGGRGGASRIVEYNPGTNGIVWSYRGSPNQPFFTNESGSHQPLQSSRVLVTASEQNRIFEVNREGEIVWEYHARPRDRNAKPTIHSAVRYSRSEVKFID